MDIFYNFVGILQGLAPAAKASAGIRWNVDIGTTTRVCRCPVLAIAQFAIVGLQGGNVPILARKPEDYYLFGIGYTFRSTQWPTGRDGILLVWRID